MIQLAYVSTARRLMRHQDLTDLLACARRFNQAHAITGMLLYKDNSFLQVLEGDAGDVAPLYERIRRDDRHIKVKTLFEQAISRRDFADWSMGFHNLDGEDLKPLEGYTDFMQSGQTARAMFENLTLAKKMLLLFRLKS